MICDPSVCVRRWTLGSTSLEVIREKATVLRKLLILLLVLFLASAFVGTLISYTPSAAWLTFALIVSGVALYVVFAVLPDQIRIGSTSVLLLRLILAILPLVVIVYFVLTNDWTYRLGKLPRLDPVLRWLAAWRLTLPGVRLDSNAFGGVVAALFPLQAAALVGSGRKLTWVGFVLLAISAAGLLLSESRGAWMALAAVAGIWGLWKLAGLAARQWAGNRPRQMQIVITASVLFIVILVGAGIVFSPFGQSVLQRRDDRLTVWHNSLDLAGDYPFTGVGLGGFDMAYSSYVVLLHVSYITHASNLYLDVWLEQGLAGLAAFAGLIVVSVLPVVESLSRGAPVSRWQIAAFASLGVVLLHGVVDDPFYGYGGIAIPFLFVPFGLLARRENPQAIHSLSKSRSRVASVLGGVTIILLAVAVLSPGVRSAFFANLGALRQTRAELSVYRWPTWSIQDELRRSNTIDLEPAIAFYETALAIDPHNATANRRLGQIELSRGQYDLAQQHLQAAYAAAPDQRATRQLLGEVYAIDGKIDQATALWNSIDVSAGQLDIRQWWYEQIGDAKDAELIKIAAR